MNILKEYMIRLGFDLDKRGMTDMLGVIEKATKTFSEFAGVSSLSLAPALKSIANNLEDLYYSSRRTQSTAKNINILRFSAEQIGLSADDASAALEGMTRQIRRNGPGMLGWLNQMGVKTTGRDRVQVLMDLVTQLKKQPFPIASRIAEEFGINDNTLFMMEQGLDQMKKAQEERAKAIEQSGVNIDEQAKQSKDFNNELRDMLANFESLAMLFEKDFLPYAHDVNAWMKEFIQLAIKADAATSGWSTKVGALVTALGGFGAVKGILGAFGIGGGAGALGSIALPLAGLGAAGYGAYKFNQEAKRQGRNPFAAFFHLDNPRTQPFLNGMPLMLGGGGIARNNPGDLRNFGNAPVSGGFAQFGTMAEGLSALAQDLLTKYRSRGLNSVSGIVSRYAPPGENDTQKYISDVAARMHVGANAALNLEDPVTLASLMSAISWREGHPVGMDLINQAVATRLGGAGSPKISVNQKTDIHVTGNGDANATARAVAGEQGRVNGDLVRNLAGAIR